MTPKQKSAEIERICEKIRSYESQQEDKIRELTNEINTIKNETLSTLNVMLDTECNASNKGLIARLLDLKKWDKRDKSKCYEN